MSDAPTDADDQNGSAAKRRTVAGLGGRLDESLTDISEVLVAMANGSFEVRAPRDESGDTVDVLAFLVNSTADEVQGLVQQLELEQDKLRRTQRQLVESEKMAALGRLAAGVAHEINQPLTVILYLLDAMRESEDGPRGAQRAARDQIDEAAEQISRIVDGVRTFGRPAALRLISTPALAALSSAERLLRAEPLDTRLGISVAAEANLPLIAADDDRLRQVFLNLLRNAREAVQASDSSEPQIVVRVRALDHEVEFAVEDNGPGVPENDRKRLFEPFFSTKDSLSMGLGLSVSLGIVGEHNGRLFYEPREQGGSRFVVRIPRSEESANKSSADPPS